MGAETGFPCDSPTDHTDLPECHFTDDNKRIVPGQAESAALCLLPANKEYSGRLDSTIPGRLIGNHHLGCARQRDAGTEPDGQYECKRIIYRDIYPASGLFIPVWPSCGHVYIVRVEG